jgi:hypothetical protein
MFLFINFFLQKQNNWQKTLFFTTLNFFQKIFFFQKPYFSRPKIFFSKKNFCQKTLFFTTKKIFFLPPKNAKNIFSKGVIFGPIFDFYPSHLLFSKSRPKKGGFDFFFFSNFFSAFYHTILS